MPFNSDAFERSQFEPRTESVSIPVLADFFDPEEEPVFIIRGLTSNELNRSIDAGSQQRDMTKIIEAISEKGAQVEDIRSALGLGDRATPAEVAKRIQMLVFCCIQPVLSMPVAAKIAENFPIEFFDLTTKISVLTGRGGKLVKPEAVSN